MFVPQQSDEARGYGQYFEDVPAARPVTSKRAEPILPFEFALALRRRSRRTGSFPRARPHELLRFYSEADYDRCSGKARPFFSEHPPQLGCSSVSGRGKRAFTTE
jgi:hypothetical protein